MMIRLSYAIAFTLMASGFCWGQQKSLVIGIDGLGFGSHGLANAETPVLDSLINGTWKPGYRGAYSDSAYAGGILGTATQQPTVSGPGWTTMLTGVWKDRHQVTGNGSSFVNGNFAANPPYLGTLKNIDPSLSTASFVNWGPIDSVLMNAVDTDSNPENDLDFRGDFGSDQEVINAAGFTLMSDSGLNPDASFVAIDEVDIVGHAHAGASDQYRQQIEVSDYYVGLILSKIAARPNFANENWQIIVTSDHGHRVEGGHGGQSSLERTIPFIVSSQDLRQGELVGNVSHADIAPTVLEHFGFGIPEHYAGISRAAGAEAPRTIIAQSNFENVSLQPFDVASGGDGTDWSNELSPWLVDNSSMQGTTVEGAYSGWTAMDVDSWINQQGVQIGRSIFAQIPHNTILVADPDAWDDFTSGAGPFGFNSYVSRSYDLSGYDTSSLRVEFEYEFAAEDSQRGIVEVSFDSGNIWQTLVEFDSQQVPADSFFVGLAQYDAGVDFQVTSDQLTLRFACVEAGNDWWFAIDNVALTVEQAIPGDVNGDGVVDLLDVQPFIEAISNGVYDAAADVNGDGADDLLDISPFIELLSV